MIEPAAVTKRAIRFHYDFVTLFYRILWGPHIHHGLWDRSADPREARTASVRQAQLRLTESLAERADPPRWGRILDVGCGMGASSLFLARHYGAQVTGITLSPIQRRWATLAATAKGLGDKARFLCSDIESVSFEPQQFDVVWSIECTEHLFDKALFFRRVEHWLRPGGKVAICAWLAGPKGCCSDREEQVARVCRSFLCPSLGTRDDYHRWMRDAGLAVNCSVDWTDRVERTWEICQRRVERFGLHRLARWIDQDTGRFVNDFAAILQAYRTGAMQYGCFVASKAVAPGDHTDGPGLPYR